MKVSTYSSWKKSLGLLQLPLCLALLGVMGLHAAPSFAQATLEKPRRLVAPKPDVAAIKKEVEQVEYAFAATMAQRKPQAFASYIADDAVFLTGQKVLEGKAAVLAGWEHFFEEPEASFSWKPDEIMVLPSGKLASSSGPVFDAKGTQIARYISIWRKDGKQWKIVMDRGVDICRCKKD